MRKPWRRLLPRCAAPAPEKLPDAGPCICPRGHDTGPPDPGWHADGNGYIWNDTLGQWRWMGPMVSLAEEYDRDVMDEARTNYRPTFEERHP